MTIDMTKAVKGATVTTAAELLRMIETVDPSDSAKLDEISLYFWRFYFQNTEEDDRDNYLRSRYKWHVSLSRDALKAIRPKDWSVDSIAHYEHLTDRSFWKVQLCEIRKGVASPSLPTEELAELHAIIQAIEYERKGT